MKTNIRTLLVLPLLMTASALYAQSEEDMVPTDEMLVENVEDMESQPEDTRRPGEVPAMFRDDALLDDSHSNQELGINVYTAPSISKIFAQLDNLPSIPEEYVLRNRPEKLPMEVGSLALEMGYLLADGFIAVRSGHMNDVKPIALDLTRYGKAIGVGEKMNVHSASLLEHAEKGQLQEFKRILSNTQCDVNSELAALRDPDLAHLLALGGWIRALDAAAAAISSHFDAEQAAVIFYPDAPAYFDEILEGLNPRTARRLRVSEMRTHMRALTEVMELAPGAAPTPEKVQQIQGIVGRISTLAVGKGYEH